MDREYLINLIYSRFGLELPYTKDDMLAMDINELSMIAYQDK